MVVPPQGVGGAPLDAGDLEDSYIARFKALDPRVARLFGYAEALVGAGVLSVDDVAKYANDVLSSPATIARFCDNVFSTSFSASILNSAYMSAPKAASILNDVNMSASKAAIILNDVNMSVSKAAAILSDVNMSASKAATVLNDVNIPVSKAVAILSDVNMSASKAAAILNDVNLSVNKTQSILYSMVDQRSYDKLLKIIASNAPDASYTANTTLSAGVNRYKNLSIVPGVTLTLGARPGVIIADSITNRGAITSGWIMSGGGAGACGGGNGGGGRGAVIILASNIDVGTVISNGVDGENSTGFTCTAAGSPGGAGNFWLISGDSVPNGGGGEIGGAGNPNGGGGGGNGGAGGSANVLTFTDAPSLLNNLFKAVCDWWLVNVMNKTPSSTVSIPSLGGSGGGGAGASNSGNVYYGGGGGGGGGGQIIIYGTSITAGSVQAKGGNGGIPVKAGYGGGGGGGIIYVFYKSLSGTFTYDVSGGTTGGAATAGGAGVFRAIPV